MKIRSKLAALGILGLSFAASAHAVAFDGTTQAGTVTTFVSGGLSDLVSAIVGLSIGVFIVGLTLKYARRGSAK